MLPYLHPFLKIGYMGYLTWQRRIVHSLMNESKLLVTASGGTE